MIYIPLLFIFRRMISFFLLKVVLCMCRVSYSLKKISCKNIFVSSYKFFETTYFDFGAKPFFSPLIE